MSSMTVGFRMRCAVLSQDVCKCNYEQQRTQRVTLCHALLQSVGDNIVHSEGLGGVSSKVNAGSFMIEKAKPCSEDGAVDELYSLPHIFPEHVVEGFL